MSSTVKETHDMIMYRGKILKHLQKFYDPLKTYKQTDAKIDYVREFVNKDGDIKIVLYPTKKCYKTQQYAPSVWHIIDNDLLNKLCNYSYYECYSYILYMYYATYTRTTILAQAVDNTQHDIRRYVDEKGLEHGTLLGILRDWNSYEE